MLVKVVENKLAMQATEKCGSRTVLAYSYLIRNPNAIKDNPRGFVSSQGDYHYTIPFERSISISMPDVKNKKYTYVSCIVRNPLDRFISAYSDKSRWYTGDEPISVEEFLDLHDSFDADKGGPVNFKNKMSLYNHIKFHIRPLSVRFGEDASTYTHIFNLNQMNDVKKLMEMVAEVKLPDLILNKNEKNKKIKLTSSQEKWILEKYKKDIEIYGKWM